MESNRLRKMMQQIEDAMAAVSFAEEGQSEADAFFKRERRVLLALKEGHTDARTLRYALNASLRINAHLDVLYVTVSERPAPAVPLLEGFTSELEASGVPYSVSRRSGCLKQEIIEYTKVEHEILFVVIESPGSLDSDCGKKDGILTELWRNLRCPLVVVIDQAGA